MLPRQHPRELLLRTHHVRERVSMPDELSAEVPVEYSSGLGAVISRVGDRHSGLWAGGRVAFRSAAAVR